MKLASRMDRLFAEGAYQVLAQTQELERQGAKIIHFEIGQPDFETPRHIAQAAISAIRQGKTKYTPSLGIRSLREAIAAEITQSRKVKTSDQNIAVTPSGKTAIFAALGAVVEKGDEVIYPDPGFPSYKATIEFFGGTPRPVPLLERNNFSFDLRALKSRFNKKTRAIIINSPSNPTGGIIPKEDLITIAKLVQGTKCWVISDEIYNKLLYTGEYASIYSIPKMKRQTFIIDGFSKPFAMTGWRLGFIVFPMEIEEKMDNLLTHMLGCTATFTQEAGVMALTGPQSIVEKMVRSYRKRRDIIVSGLNQIPKLSCKVPSGAFYVFPNIKKMGMNSDEFADKLLEQAGVAVLPGTCFGKYGEGYIRMSYATREEDIIEGLKRMRKFLD